MSIKDNKFMDSSEDKVSHVEENDAMGYVTPHSACREAVIQEIMDRVTGLKIAMETQIVKFNIIERSMKLLMDCVVDDKNISDKNSELLQCLIRQNNQNGAILQKIAKKLDIGTDLPELG